MWKDDQFHGFGICQWKNGTQEAGQYKHGVADGKRTRYGVRDGYILNIDFTNGQRIALPEMATIQSGWVSKSIDQI